jgi:hypothetical protein
VPFTISHAAAVLPLKKTRMPLAALMVGSMAPDFAYFHPFTMQRTSTHDVDGLFLFCWPVGLLVWLFYVHVLERPTIELLPDDWRARVTPSDRRITFASLAWASLAVIVGAITHDLWDAFTHGNTFITSRFQAFNIALFDVQGRTVRVYFMLQVLCSIVGLFALWLWALNIRRGEPRVAPMSDAAGFVTNRTRILAVLWVIVMSGLMALLGYAGSAGEVLEERVFRLLIGGMAGGFLAWCGIAVLITRTTRVTRSRQAGG